MSRTRVWCAGRESWRTEAQGRADIERETDVPRARAVRTVWQPLERLTGIDLLLRPAFSTFFGAFSVCHRSVGRSVKSMKDFKTQSFTGLYVV